MKMNCLRIVIYEVEAWKSKILRTFLFFDQISWKIVLMCYGCQALVVSFEEQGKKKKQKIVGPNAVSLVKSTCMVFLFSCSIFWVSYHEGL